MEKGKPVKELSSLAAVAAQEAEFVMNMPMKEAVKSSSKGDIADAGCGDGAGEPVEGRDRGRRCWETELEKVKLNRHA